MDKKKQFVTPRVLQEVQVQLEKDLLGDSVRLGMKVSSMGQGVKNYDFSDSDDEEATYFSEWD
jgi:hypothetical protein